MDRARISEGIRRMRFEALLDRYELIDLTPRLLEISTRVYAQTFTEKELSDVQAFQTSESGKSMIAKMPAVQAQVAGQILPVVMAALPGMLRKSADRNCEQKHCTTAQRAALEKALDKAYGHAGSSGGTMDSSLDVRERNGNMTGGLSAARLDDSMFETLGRVMTSKDHTLKLKCTACGHQDEWSREKALATLGPQASPHLVRHNMVCGACYARRRTEVWI